MINWINRTREKPLIFLQNGSSFNTKYSKYSNVECLRNLITYSSLSRRIIKWRDEVATTSPKTPTFDREWNALREREFSRQWTDFGSKLIHEYFENSHGTQFRNFISIYFSNSRRIFVVSTGQLFSMICDNWERLELYCAINVIESIGGVIGERFRKERCKYSFLFSSLSPSFPCLFVFFFVYRVFIKMWFQATKRTIR